MSLKSLETWMANSLVGVSTSTYRQMHRLTQRSLDIKIMTDVCMCACYMCVPWEDGPSQHLQTHSGASLLMEWRRRKSFLFLFWLGQSHPHHHKHGWKFSPECQTGRRLLGLWKWKTDATERKGRKESGTVKGGGHQTKRSCLAKISQSEAKH